MKDVLIFGVTGQDGQFLAHSLINKKGPACVVGVARKSHFPDFNPLNLNRPQYISGDIADFQRVVEIIKTFQPTEIYNLAGESSVANSFLNPLHALNSNVIGILNILNAVKQLNYQNRTRIFQASSSEMFGNSLAQLNENSDFCPVSPYAISKYIGHKICLEYRSAYGLWITTGILFNHESELHSDNFVFQKVIKSLINYTKGCKSKLKLGNINIERDWGYAPEYVEAMIKIMHLDSPSDYVISSGKSNSLINLIHEVMSQLNIKEKVDNLIEIDQKLSRPTDITKTWGDSSKVHEITGWKASTDFKELVSRIINFNLN